MAITEHRMRLAEERDLPRLREIAAEAFGAAAPDLASLVGQESLYVAAWRTSIDGFVVLMPLKDALLVQRLAVAEEARRRGIGSWLLDCAAMHARNLNLRAIELQMPEHDPARLAWLARLGFVPQRQGGNRTYLRKLLD
ncbi:MAG TPA: GNAT family N-acetyltransferase [Ferrovibrio sp.]|uniref:GNAT family N-acetyltransferase n=1 Tax=Ferrovibrio sp. TaxID=1917215 RepID=UPI002ED3236F